MSKHLGSTEELLHFLMEMNDELDKHRRQKEPLREVNIHQVISIAVPEIRKRLKIILKAHNEIYNGKNTYENQQIIKKQSVHIGNYIMMVFCKAREF